MSNQDIPDLHRLLELARSLRVSGDADGCAAAVDQVIALDPRNIAGLLMKADLLTERGDARGGVSFYAAIARLGTSGRDGAMFRNEIQRARGIVEKFARELEDHIRAHLASHGFSDSNFPPRFAKAIDILVGKKKAYQQAPRHLFYPELAPIQFYDRADFPFLDAIEAAYDDIRAELENTLSHATGFEPYVKSAGNRPPNSQRGMADNTAWSAYFLIKDGAVSAGGHKCPKTLAALDSAPLARIPHHSPTALFSKLASGAHIPAHTGMINTRLICHLPLTVPDRCSFRVGNETRNWKEGQPWVFDDTIEHEAWNGGTLDRTILIFDIWRPELAEEERAAFGLLCVAMDKYAGTQSWE